MPTEEETERRVDIATMAVKVDSTEKNVEKLIGYFEGENNIFTTITINGRIAKAALIGVGLLAVCIIGDIKLADVLISIFG